jgi:predicted dehydrogenase
MYGPILKSLPSETQLVSIWGRSKESAKILGEKLNVPWYTNIRKLIRETDPQIGIVCVAYDANGTVGLMAVDSGLNVLLETPIAHDLKEADEIIRIAREKNLIIEVAEQFHRRPMEQLKIIMIQTGIFGQVLSAFNDFAGHGYHGVSVLRSYLGFDSKPIKVHGIVKQYDLAPHWSRLADTSGHRAETQEHGIIEFEGGQIGIFHWTDVGYDSALRWWRSSRFLAEKGMGITIGVGLDVEERLSILSSSGEAPQFITVERRWERVDGGSLVAIIAHTEDPKFPVIRWDNPFLSDTQRHGVQWHDDEIGVASCLMSLVNAIRNNAEPTYGPLQARLDQEIVLAIQASAKENGRPMNIPLSEEYIY